VRHGRPRRQRLLLRGLRLLLRLRLRLWRRRRCQLLRLLRAGGAGAARGWGALCCSGAGRARTGLRACAARGPGWRSWCSVRECASQRSLERHGRTFWGVVEEDASVGKVKSKDSAIPPTPKF
jgi:hypothetical protein